MPRARVAKWQPRASAQPQTQRRRDYPAGRENKVRYLKMFGLAAIAAVAAMAFIGASSASATQSTQICNEPSGTLACPAGKATTTLHGVATEPLLHSSLVNVKCESSLVKASLLALGNPQVAHLEELTWTGCKTHGGANCTVTTLLKGLFNILKLSTTDAHAKSTGGTVVLVECGIFIHCSYGGEPTLLAEGSPADLKANTVVTSAVGHPSFFCPETSTWLALYKSLTNIYIRG